MEFQEFKKQVLDYGYKYLNSACISALKDAFAKMDKRHTSEDASVVIAMLHHICLHAGNGVVCKDYKKVRDLMCTDIYDLLVETIVVDSVKPYLNYEDYIKIIE